MNRRGFLKSILAAGVAPYVVTTAGVLMPVKKIVSLADFMDLYGVVYPYTDQIFPINGKWEMCDMKLWGVSRVSMPDYIEERRRITARYRIRMDSLSTPA